MMCPGTSYVCSTGNCTQVSFVHVFNLHEVQIPNKLLIYVIYTYSYISLSGQQMSHTSSYIPSGDSRFEQLNSQTFQYLNTKVQFNTQK